MRLNRLREWRPEDPGPFIATLKETGASPLRVHLSVVREGQRLAGGLLSSLGQLDAGGNWLVEWHEPSTLRPSLELAPDEEGDKQPPIHLLLELVDVCLLYTSPSPRDEVLSRMPSSA